MRTAVLCCLLLFGCAEQPKCLEYLFVFVPLANGQLIPIRVCKKYDAPIERKG